MCVCGVCGYGWVCVCASMHIYMHASLVPQTPIRVHAKSVW